ncbi:hypothetical protein OCGS_0467 [Oceaniovalibus guishaninsula JLT2003]|uniref:Metal-binding protein n=1 Tax=Oceaniovalibus guishaninsula JLT2003 TaxID=1231392 RepID=K2HFX2_9RHOB|nr:DUF1636 family protein [Oceaniovalibus guishaninsula]EKE45377.1 hypothetical protein OCGS_0467 [Oceaniovalibus guishaninsula JLT2003]
MSGAVLRLCGTCRGSDADRLRDRIAAAGLPVRIVAQDCLNACGNPVAMALQGKGRATYLFAGVAPESDAEDIVATLRLYLDAPAGWIEDARPCGRLRRCLLGRISAL